MECVIAYNTRRKSEVISLFKPPNYPKTKRRDPETDFLWVSRIQIVEEEEYVFTKIKE